MGVPITIFGVESLLLVLMLGGGMYAFLLILLPIHFSARWMHSRDDGAFEAMFTYMREQDVYDPWHRPATTTKRPAGYGKDLQC